MALATDSANGAASVISNLQNWAKAPFTSNMSLKGWFAFTGLVLCAVIAWTMILRDLKRSMIA